MESFHRGVLREMAASDGVHLNTLRVDGRIVAVNSVLHRGRRSYGYAAGFDPEFARFNPGSLILAYSIEREIERGAKTFDFLRGSESYKQQWGAVPYTSRRLLLWHGEAPHELLT